MNQFNDQHDEVLVLDLDGDSQVAKPVSPQPLRRPLRTANLTGMVEAEESLPEERPLCASCRQSASRLPLPSEHILITDS